MNNYLYYLNNNYGDFMTKTITIELTDDQYETVQLLESKGITVGEAITKLVEIQEAYETNGYAFVDSKIDEANKKKAELEKQIEEADKQITILSKLKDKTLEFEEKQKFIEKEFSSIGDSDFQDTVRKIKQNTSFNIFKY